MTLTFQRSSLGQTLPTRTHFLSLETDGDGRGDSWWGAEPPFHKWPQAYCMRLDSAAFIGFILQGPTAFRVVTCGFLSRKDMSVVNKHMKRCCSSSLEKLKQTNKNPPHISYKLNRAMTARVGDVRRNGNPQTLLRDVNGLIALLKRLTCFQKLKHVFTHDPVAWPPGMCPRWI